MHEHADERIDDETNDETNNWSSAQTETAEEQWDITMHLIPLTYYMLSTPPADPCPGKQMDHSNDCCIAYSKYLHY